MNKDERYKKAAEKLVGLLEIMDRLRKECPWDAKQTHNSLRPYLLEETYEVLETLDREEWEKLAGELGDLLLQIVFHSVIAAESGRFEFADVVDHISKKLVERHPHVFGDKQVHDAKTVQENWEHTKVKNEERDSILSGVPKAMPALLQAQRLQEKAATVGFDWGSLPPVIAKVDEEWQEFKTAVANADLTNAQEEFGDLLFSIVNISRFIDISAEDALRNTSRKFISRFSHIEKQYNNNPAAMKAATLEELDHYWNEAKEQKKKNE